MKPFVASLSKIFEYLFNNASVCAKTPLSSIEVSNFLWKVTEWLESFIPEHMELQVSSLIIYQLSLSQILRASVKMGCDP